MDLLSGILAGLIGYLLGSISFSRTISRIFVPEKPLENLTYKLNTQNEEKDNLIYAFNLYNK